MKLAYVFNFTGGGGATTQAWTLAKAFSEKGIDVTCVNANELGMLDLVQSTWADLPVVYPTTIVEALKQLKSDIVLLHAYNAGLIPYIADGLVKEKFGIRAGSNLLEYHVTQVLYSFPGWVTDLYVEYSRCDFVVSPSEWHTKQLRWIYDDALKIYTIPVGVLTKSFIPTDYKIDGKLHVLIACRHAPNNWVTGMLAVLRKLPDVRAHIIGMSVGVYEQGLRQLIKQWNMRNVEFIGQVDEATKMKLFEIADVFLLPSISHNGVPVSVVEALAAGTVVIASDIPVMREIQTPVAVALDDFEGWYDYIRMANEDEDWARQKMKEGIEEANRFDINVIVKEYIKMFREVLE